MARRPAARIKFITGDDKLDRKLKALGYKATKFLKKGLGKGMTPLVRSMRRLAPKGETKALSKSIGKRFKKVRKLNVIEAKCGVNVAKKAGKPGEKPAKGQQAPHGPIVAIGTDERRTKQGKNRGKMRPNDFIKRAHSQSGSQCLSITIAETGAALLKEATR